MKEFIEKINHTSASNAASALGNSLIEGDMNEDTREISPIARSASVSRVIATTMNKNILKIRLVGPNGLVRALGIRQMINRIQLRGLILQPLWLKTALTRLENTFVGFARRN